MWGVVQQAISLDVDFVAYADRHFTRMFDGAGALAIDELLATAAEPI